MKIFCKFPTVNIWKLNFWLVICIAKNFIWTTLKVIFSIFRFFCQIFKYCPIITNHTSMESYLFSFQMMYKSQFQKMDLYDWFCAPGSHMCVNLTLSAARILKEAMTCSEVSVSPVSRVMKSTNDWNVTTPEPLGSTRDMIRANSASPCRERQMCSTPADLHRNTALAAALLPDHNP